MATEIVIEKDLMVPMRDGVALATDVYRPRTEATLPVLLQRTPYCKEFATITDLVRMAQAGYAVVVQDTRGRYGSGGAFDPFLHEAEDGVAAIAWAAGQPWSSGKIGTIGASYVGAAQWLAATQAPPALRAMAPALTGDDYYEGWTYQGGAFQLGFILIWTLRFLAMGELQRRGENGAELNALIAAIDAAGELYRRLPLMNLQALAELAPYYNDWLAHPSYDAFWRGIAPRESYERTTVPALNIGGWYDLFLGGTLANYRGMKARGGSHLARSGQRLIIGPWAHAVMGGDFADRSYGLRSDAGVLDLTALQIRWFDHWLKGLDNGVDREQPVRIFVMGSNLWRDEGDWPLPDTIYRAYFLHSDGRANTAAGDGRLTTQEPGAESPDAFLYDPRNPVPTIGGPVFLPGLFVAANTGPCDQRPVEGRQDVLCYTSEPLDWPLEVTGPVELFLYASSSAVDTDFTGKLVDVWPDGRAEILTEGILRARYRESTSEPKPLQPGHIYELRLDLWATSNRFDAGHRIRLEVSSSNFPRFDRNSNTGGAIALMEEGDLTQALNRIYHDRSHPSHLLLPVIERY